MNTSKSLAIRNVGRLLVICGVLLSGIPAAGVDAAVGPQHVGPRPLVAELTLSPNTQYSGGTVQMLATWLKGGELVRLIQGTPLTGTVMFTHTANPSGDAAGTITAPLGLPASYPYSVVGVTSNLSATAYLSLVPQITGRVTSAVPGQHVVLQWIGLLSQ